MYYVFNLGVWSYTDFYISSWFYLLSLKVLKHRLQLGKIKPMLSMNLNTLFISTSSSDHKSGLLIWQGLGSLVLLTLVWGVSSVRFVFVESVLYICSWTFWSSFELSPTSLQSTAGISKEISSPSQSNNFSPSSSWTSVATSLKFRLILIGGVITSSLIDFGLLLSSTRFEKQ